MEKQTNKKDTLALKGRTILVTGHAGFIGYHLTKKLLQSYGDVRIIGIDNFNDYYDVSLKEWRAKELTRLAAQTSGTERLVSLRGSLSDKTFVDDVFATDRPDIVVNLAAQAGVRYSIDHPEAYMEANLTGFFHILEACRHSYDGSDPDDGVKHLVYASSSSVYGGNTKIPFSEEDAVDHPVSLYAATKKSNELLSHSYAKLYAIPSTGLRFFTVYGPAGRPDMACYLFTEGLRKGGKIKIFNYGNCQRDFTYVDDIVDGILRVMQKPPARAVGEDGLPKAPYDIYNIGNSHPENLMDFVHILARELMDAKVLPADFDIEAHLDLVAMQPGDVPVTYADTAKLERDTGFKPSTPLSDGIRSFAAWYHDYEGIQP